MTIPNKKQVPGDDPAAVTKLYPPNVGGHLDSPTAFDFLGSRELTIPKRSRSQNCQVDEIIIKRNLKACLGKTNPPHKETTKILKTWDL